MTQLHILKVPGMNIADYKKIESVFPKDAYENRMKILLSELKSTGLTYENLEHGVKSSLTLITESDALPRLVINVKSEKFFIETDALAVSLRIARELAQRRGRGEEKQSIAFKLIAERLLIKYGSEPNDVKLWRNCIEFLASEKKVWDWETITNSAESMPVSVLMQALNKRMPIAWSPVIRPVKALHWIAQDLGKLLCDAPPFFSLHHTGPISDLLAGKITEELESKERIKLVISALDMYAEQVFNIQKSNEYEIPSIILSYCEPIYKYATEVFSGLEERNYV